jgi:hypothetical protein
VRTPSTVTAVGDLTATRADTPHAARSGVITVVEWTTVVHNPR